MMRELKRMNEDGLIETDRRNIKLLHRAASETK